MIIEVLAEPIIVEWIKRFYYRRTDIYESLLYDAVILGVATTSLPLHVRKSQKDFCLQLHQYIGNIAVSSVWSCRWQEGLYVEDNPSI